MDIPEKEAEFLQKIQKAFKKKVGLKDIEILKKSIDARDKENVKFVYNIQLGTKKKLVGVDNYEKITEAKTRPVVVGSGPAGLFCALVLATVGLSPIVLERGKTSSERVKDVEKFFTSGVLNRESNVQFGEGGAGAFSDGKLTTGIKDPHLKIVLEELVKLGAPEDILIAQKPHIGTDKLIPIIANLRKKIISLGGEFRFNNKVVKIEHIDGKLQSLKVQTPTEVYDIKTDFAVLAIGHSARDTVEMLLENGVNIMAKAFAVGLRIEHKQDFINQSQYGKFSKYLPSAEYKLAVNNSTGRGVYTFCMCPGGLVVGATSEENGVVTNGMSYHTRDLENANSALLVTVSPDDFGHNPLDGINFQRGLEKFAFLAGGKNYFAPVQTVGDFMIDKNSRSLYDVIPSYKPGITLGGFNEVLPPYIVDALKAGLLQMDKKIAGFASATAVLTGVESRSSSPVKIIRGDNFNSNIIGLIPCGEGAGYAGGISSSAVDGIKCAKAVIQCVSSL